MESWNFINDVLNEPSGGVEDYINELIAKKAKMMMQTYENKQIEIQNDMFRQLNEVNRILDETKNMRKTVCRYYLTCVTFCIAIGIIIGLIAGVIMEIRKLAFNIGTCVGKILLVILFLFALMISYFMTNFFTDNISHFYIE